VRQGHGECVKGEAQTLNLGSFKEAYPNKEKIITSIDGL